MKKGSGYEVKVGIFVTVVLALLMMVIIALSSKSTMFERTYFLETNFSNVGGLSEGAVVRLAGVDIGYVRRIRFAEDVDEPRVYVTFSVDTEGLLRLTKDTRATIQSSGLLGNKYLALVPGDPGTGFVKEGATMKGVDPVDFTDQLQNAGGAIDSIGALAESIRQVVDSIGGEGKSTDLSRAITSLKNIVAGIETGPGLAHALIFDPRREAIVEDLAGAVHDLRVIIADIREGEGTISTLIYDDKGGEVIANLAGATEAIEEVLLEVRDGQGTLHKLVYGTQREDIVDELSRTAENLRAVSETIRRGEGTLGGLIYDPTIYEDVKKITGEVSRSRVLKSIIRCTLRRAESKRERKARDAY